MIEQLTVFVSSAMAELESEREVAERVIRDLNFEPRLFELFPAMSRSPVRAFVDAVRECKIFVLMLWKTYPDAVEQEYKEAQATGKPILIFLKRLSDDDVRDPKLENLIKELVGKVSQSSATAVSATRTTFDEFRKLKDLTSSMKSALIAEIAKHYRPPTFTLTRRELYKLGTDIVLNAERRLYVVQRTPILFLGAREYFSPNTEKIDYELQFLEALEKWVNHAAVSDRQQLVYVFSPEATRAEVAVATGTKAEFKAEFIEKIKRNVAKYKEIERKSGTRLRFLPITVPFSGPITVGDNRFAMWLFGQDIALSQESELMANNFVRFIEHSIVQSADVNDILSGFGIA